MIIIWMSLDKCYKTKMHFFVFFTNAVIQKFPGTTRGQLGVAINQKVTGRNPKVTPRIRHGLPSPRIRHGLPSPLTRHGSQNGRRPGGLLSCPVSVSLKASRAPPPPRWMVYGAGRTVREGGVLSDLCSPCHVFPLLSCPYLVFLFLSSFVFISLRLCLIVPHLFQFFLV